MLSTAASVLRSQHLSISTPSDVLVTAIHQWSVTSSTKNLTPNLPSRFFTDIERDRKKGLRLFIIISEL
jgi:hypothetical protein